MFGLDKREEKIPSTVDLVATENADYRVIRSRHSRPNTKEEVGKATILCDEIEFLPNTVLHNARHIFEYQRSHIQSRDIVALPSVSRIYVVDTVYTPGFKRIHQNENLDRALRNMIGQSAAILGLSTFFAGALTRRKALLGVGAGIVGLAGYVTAPNVAIRMISKGHKGKLLESLQKSAQKFEIYFRNLVIAHKAEYIAEQERKSTGKKPLIALTTGAEHGLVTRALAASKETRERLLRDLISELRTLAPKEDVELLEEHIYLIPSWDKRTGKAGILDMRTGNTVWRN